MAHQVDARPRVLRVVIENGVGQPRPLLPRPAVVGLIRQDAAAAVRPVDGNDVERNLLAEHEVLEVNGTLLEIAGAIGNEDHAVCPRRAHGGAAPVARQRAARTT